MKKGFVRKLLGSFVALMLCLTTLSASTFAWFSMNSKVNVTGMAVTTRVENNLAIATSTAGADKVADSTFTNALHQVVTGSLQPVSTVDGVSFFYTTDAAEDGHKIDTGAYTALVGNDIEINSTHYKGYVDCVFELKASNAGDAVAYLNLSKLNLLYAGTDATTHAFRVAVFVQSESTAFGAADDDTRAAAYTGAYNALGATTDSIFAKSGSAYFTTGKAVKTTSSVDTVTAASAISKQVAAGTTEYFKVTVRLWLEGEDTDCYNTKFVELTNNWTLDLAFTLDDSATPAKTVLGSEVNATNTSNGTTLTVALTNGETAVSYAWYRVGGDGTAVSTTATYSPADSAFYYCAITTAKGNVYNTPAAQK